MKMTKQDLFYAGLGGVSLFAFVTAGTGSLQEWMGLDFAETLFMLAIILASFACQHALLICLVALSRLRAQPILWLLRRSRAVIRTVLHLSAISILAIGVPVGWLIDSNHLLALTAGVALNLSLAVELTFKGDMGPLAALLRERDRYTRVQ